MKLSLPLKTLQQDGQTRIRAWFRVAIFSIPFSHLATASQMGGKYPSTHTLHMKQRWSLDIVKTFPVGATV